MELTDGQREALDCRLSAVYCALGYSSFWKGDPHGALKPYFKALMLPGKKLHALKYIAATPLSALIGLLGSGSK
jgi:hypothetical protein